MGRWRDPVKLMNWDKKLRLEELTIDQQSEIVGKKRDKLFRVTKYELNRPLIMEVKLFPKDFEGLRAEKNPIRHSWWDPKGREVVYDLLEFNNTVYRRFRRNITKRFGNFPLGNEFEAYIRGGTSYTEGESGLVTLARVPVTPIHIQERDFQYTPVLSGQSVIYQGEDQANYGQPICPGGINE
ncbi:hypothetical protein GOV03_02875 [Candidatus Woesearchaeota archaeon]|nr:hypothetical protein [Candidatus Woesearchaeota archaeon]